MSEADGKEVKVAVSEGNGLAGLSTREAEHKQHEFGFNEVTTEEEPEWKKIIKRFFGIVPMVMFVAAMISISVEAEGQRDYVSFGLLIFEINLIVFLSWYSDRNAGNALKEIKALSVPFTMVRRDGKWVTVPQRELVPGDIIQVKGGDVVPADARVVGEGEPMKVDESSLTGESLPVTKRTGDDVLSGSVISQGERELEVTSTGALTFFGKTIELLQQSSGDTGHLQQVLNQAAYIMTFLGFAGCICIFVVVLTRGYGVGPSFIITFVVLAAVVPAGMPVVVTTVLAVGSRELAKEKAIVSRLSAMEELSGMEVLYSDKTGTLTKNELELDKGEILTWGKNTADDVLRMAALSAKWHNQDAIDRAITGALGNEERAISGYNISRFVPFNPVDKRTEVTVTGPTGDVFLATKGAPHVIMDMLAETSARSTVATYIDEKAERGLRSLGVAQSTNGGATWQLIGLLALLDPPRDDCAETLRRAQDLGLEVKMITGDQTAIAIETARRLGLGTNIVPSSELQHEHATDLASFTDACDGFAGVYPEHKFKIVEALRLKGRLVGMTGDGVNDAPALKKANVGIAVAGATAAAKGAADIILTEPGLSTIITAIIRSRKIFRRLESYIVYRMASSVVIMLFFFFALIVLKFDFPPWVLIFLSLINDFTVMATSSDNVYCSPSPEIWNMPRVIVLAAAIGTTGFLGSLFLINLARPEKWNWWHLFNLGFKDDDGHADAQVVAAIFLSLAIAIQLNIFSSRNPSFFFWFSKTTVPPPSIILVLPVFCSLLASTFIAVYWPRGTKLGTGAEMAGIGWGAAGIVWAYQLLWFFLTDMAKVLASYVYDQVPNIDISEALVGGPFMRRSQKTIADRLKKIRQAAKRELILRRRRGSITRTATDGVKPPSYTTLAEEPSTTRTRLLGIEEDVHSLKSMFTSFISRFDNFERRFNANFGSDASASTGEIS